MKKLIYKLLGITVISNTFIPKAGRTEKQGCYDAVLQLQRELVTSRAIKVTHNADGTVTSEIKCLG